jgi:hypothetical protein
MHACVDAEGMDDFCSGEPEPEIKWLWSPPLAVQSRGSVCGGAVKFIVCSVLRLRTCLVLVAACRGCCAPCCDWGCQVALELATRAGAASLSPCRIASNAPMGPTCPPEVGARILGAYACEVEAAVAVSGLELKAAAEGTSQRHWPCGESTLQVSCECGTFCERCERWRGFSD